jgi:hypothetical protein
MSRRLVPDRLADQCEDEWFGDALDRERRLDVTDLEEPARGPDHADPEQPRRCARQSGDVIRDGTVAVGPIALVCFGDEIPYLLGLWKLAGGDQRRRGRLVERETLVHGKLGHEIPTGP